MIQRNILLLFLLYILIFSSHKSFAQQACDCQKEFLFVKNYMEKNYAGFADKVTDSNIAEYNTFSDGLLAKSKLSLDQNNCYFIISSWLNYFKDGHVQFGNNATEPNKKDSYEKISLTAQQIKELENKPLDNIEGIYISESKNYKIALVKSMTDFRDYAGVIIKAKSKLWEVGHIKIELRHLGNDVYESLYYMQDHEARARTYTIKNGRFSPDKFIKISLVEDNKSKDDPTPKLLKKLEYNSNRIAYYKDIDDSTAYLRIKSFDGSFAKQIAEVIKSNETKLKAKPYLIIDIRYNGGGSDFSYSPLKPFIYTQPIKTIGADIYSTPDNIIAWQKILTNYPDIPKDIKKDLIEVIQKMKDSPNQLVSIMDNGIDSLDIYHANPRKIAILIDGNCASSAEQFLLAARQSKKVILMGQPTSGTLDYSNMRTINMECMPYTLAYATSRSRRIPENAIDNIGILPEIEIDFSLSWLGIVLKNLKQSKKN